MANDIHILYADQHILAVAKPARIPTASDASGDDTLLARVRRWNEARQVEGRKGYCVPIHFLDRPVSGLILFGLSSKGASRLNEQFRNRSMQKTYLALVEGHPTVKSGRLEHYLSKDKQSNVTRITNSQDPEGKRSVLAYRVIAEKGPYSCLLVTPETGRSHQIRVQLASLKTPIYGDLKYGSATPWDGSIALHAFQLAFAHPIGKIAQSLCAPIPENWRDIWDPLDLEALAKQALLSPAQTVE